MSDNWKRIELLTAYPEPAAAELWRCGALGVERQDRETFMEDGSMLPVPDGLTRLIAFFPDDAIEPTFQPQLVSASVWTDYNDRSWETAWMAFFKPTPLSKRAVVRPPWEERGNQEIDIVIEPGMAFGTGTHETTQLVAEWLDELANPKTTVFDIGCGTGILSILCAKLGANVTGMDVDADAVDIAIENCEHNDVNVALSALPLDTYGTFDLVVANILAHILVSIQDDIYPRVKPGGILLVSGITVDQSEKFSSDFVADGWQIIQQRTKGQWVAMMLQKNP